RAPQRPRHRGRRRQHPARLTRRRAAPTAQRRRRAQAPRRLMQDWGMPAPTAAPPPGLRAVRSPDWAAAVADRDIAVLMLHGYGADERDLIGIVEALGITAPWASLRAPLALAGTSGAAWFPIERLDALRIGPV